MPWRHGTDPATRPVLEARILDSSLRSAAFGMTVVGVSQGSPKVGIYCGLRATTLCDHNGRNRSALCPVLPPAYLTAVALSRDDDIRPSVASQIGDNDLIGARPVLLDESPCPTSPRESPRCLNTATLPSSPPPVATTSISPSPSRSTPTASNPNGNRSQITCFVHGDILGSPSYSYQTTCCTANSSGRLSAHTHRRHEADSRRRHPYRQGSHESPSPRLNR